MLKILTQYVQELKCVHFAEFMTFLETLKFLKTAQKNLHLIHHIFCFYPMLSFILSHSKNELLEVETSAISF